jgi:ERCC4-type nuclease
MIFVSPAEPRQFKTLGQVSVVPEQYGADFLITGHGFLIAVQRKAFPGDFLSSIYDGRFSTLLPKMLGADLRLLVLEGRPKWTDGGGLAGIQPYGGAREFTRSKLRAMCHSLHHLWGVGVDWTDDPIDTAAYLQGLDAWAQKDDHTGLGVRPGMGGQFGRQPSPRDQAIYFLSGLPGIGPDLAGRIYDTFGAVPAELSITRAELESVPGLGKGRVDRIVKVLKPKESSYATTAEPAVEPVPKPKRVRKSRASTSTSTSIL